MYKEIKINPFISIMIIIVLEFFLTINSYAESVKIVQWWDEYLPQKFERDAYLGYSGEVTSQQKQDLNGDGIHNDASVCRAFNLTDSFNPYPACKPDSKDGNRYRTDRPSATFYGGLIGRYTNVSDITEDYRGEQIPVFRKTGQATIQPVEGAKPNLYDSRYPHNTRRAGGAIGGIEWGLGWPDITLQPLSQKGLDLFETREDIEQNFTFIAIWKKEDFVNGGASTQKIIFDSTSKISVDVTRVRDTDECRFIAQDGDQLWISEYTYDARDKPPITVELNPLSSRWAVYEPSDCDMEFNLKTANFTEHTFQDVQAVGVYFANRQFAHEQAGIFFDNFQAYAVTTDSILSESSTNDQHLIGLSVNSDSKSVSTDAQFSQDITVNGSTVTVNASDQMDIRGVITVDSEHVGKEAEIIVVVGYTPTSSTEELFFMFDQYGKVLPWDGNMNNLVAYEKTDLIRKNKDEERVKRNIILMPERRVQIFPVSLSAFRDKQLDTILLGCEERPLTYSGLLNEVPSGLLRFFFGYRLKENGTIVYNSESINVIVTAN